MRTLETKQEIAYEINIKRTPTVRLDLAERGGGAIQSQKILVDDGFYKDGAPKLINATIKAYSDRRKFIIHEEFVGISSQFTYHDAESMLEYANAPVLKADNDFVLYIVDSENHVAYPPIVLRLHKQACRFYIEENDASAWFE